MTYHHVAISRTDQNAAREEQIAGTRFVNFKSAAFVEALGEHFGETLGHVLHDQNCIIVMGGRLRLSKSPYVWTTRIRFSLLKMRLLFMRTLFFFLAEFFSRVGR